MKFDTTHDITVGDLSFESLIRIFDWDLVIIDWKKESQRPNFAFYMFLKCVARSYKSIARRLPPRSRERTLFSLTNFYDFKVVILCIVSSPPTSSLSLFRRASHNNNKKRSICTYTYISYSRAKASSTPSVLQRFLFFSFPWTLEKKTGSHSQEKEKKRLLLLSLDNLSAHSRISWRNP